MMGLGCAGTINELFFQAEPRRVGLAVSILLLMGPGFITAAWQAYNAGRRPALDSPSSRTPDPGASPSQASSSPPSL
jgi:hypothetical protein